MMNKLFLKSNPIRMELAIAIIRIAVGVGFIFHGYPKMEAGHERWLELGVRMRLFGIDFLPTAWGFLCAFSEFFGGIGLAVGFLVRPFAFMLMITMTVAMIYLVSNGASYNDYSHPLKLIFVFFGLLISGTDQYSIDRMISRKLAASKHEE